MSEGTVVTGTSGYGPDRRQAAGLHVRPKVASEVTGRSTVAITLDLYSTSA